MEIALGGICRVREGGHPLSIKAKGIKSKVNTVSFKVSAHRVHIRALFTRNLSLPLVIFLS
jgi:hypothetical protein